jgi:hypothetical protein
MLQSLYTQLAAVASLLICGFAIISGSWRERLCGVLYLAAYVLLIGLGLVSTRYAVVYGAVADALLVPGVLVIARKSPHIWPRCVLVLQIFSVGIDIAALTYKGISVWLYLTAQNAAGYAILLCLLVGTFGARARRRAEKQASR